MLSTNPILNSSHSVNNGRNVRLIAFYLPQFHPIPENDEWWGKGFTEWTNVAQAKPLFRGHYQPHLPADLGFYDLRLPEVQEAQAALAQEYGIHGFCYYHYWFNGKRLLSRPLDQMLQSGKPDFPFCLCWANESWSGIWHGDPNRILIEQTYPGMKDHKKHFYALLKAFSDRRYITIDGKPLLLIYKPGKLPHSKRALDLWRQLARQAGLKDLYIVAICHSGGFWNPINYGYDAITVCNQTKIFRLIKGHKLHKVKNNIKQLLGLDHKPFIVDYKRAIPYFIENVPSSIIYYPCVIPNWDNTPRCGLNGVVLHNSTPQLFRSHLRQAVNITYRNCSDKRIIFIKSWNEWAEGNYLEPDHEFRHGYLEAVKAEVLNVIA